MHAPSLGSPHLLFFPGDTYSCVPEAPDVKTATPQETPTPPSPWCQAISTCFERASTKSGALCNMPVPCRFSGPLGVKGRGVPSFLPEGSILSTTFTLDVAALLYRITQSKMQRHGRARWNDTNNHTMYCDPAARIATETIKPRAFLCARHRYARTTPA